MNGLTDRIEHNAQKIVKKQAQKKAFIIFFLNFKINFFIWMLKNKHTCFKYYFCGAI